jgi:hypothetical protein
MCCSKSGRVSQLLCLRQRNQTFPPSTNVHPPSTAGGTRAPSLVRHRLSLAASSRSHFSIACSYHNIFTIRFSHTTSGLKSPPFSRTPNTCRFHRLSGLKAGDDSSQTLNFKQLTFQFTPPGQADYTLLPSALQQTTPDSRITPSLS